MRAAVGFLHDVVEDTPRSIQDVRDGFGETIAAMVQALTEDDSIHNYASASTHCARR